MAERVHLRRVLGLPLLTLYGLGNILGAGVYVLIGQVAGMAGYAAPLSFVLALVVAALTALTYMELSSRYPQTAAVPVYLHHAFGRPRLAAAVGLLLTAAGIVSAATLTRGFVGYFDQLLPAPDWLVAAGVVTLLAVVAVAGIAQSARLAAAFTLVEVGGLLLVIAASAPSVGHASQVFGGLAAGAWQPGVLTGAFLAFYAFLGFEDMVEVAEEVKEPRRTLPRAMLLALITATLLYMVVMVAALLVKSPEQLAASKAPLVDVFTAGTGASPLILAVIGLASIVNGILAHIIMGGRILYGLAAQGWIHHALGTVQEAARTPVVGTVVVAALIAVLATALPVVRLAEFTSFLVLLVFTVVNVALVVIKRRDQQREGDHVTVPLWVPMAGAASTTGMLLVSFVR